MVNGGIGVRNQMFDFKGYDVNHCSKKLNIFECQTLFQCFLYTILTTTLWNHAISQAPRGWAGLAQ